MTASEDARRRGGRPSGISQSKPSLKALLSEPHCGPRVLGDRGRGVRRVSEYRGKGKRASRASRPVLRRRGSGGTLRARAGIPYRLGLRGSSLGLRLEHQRVGSWSPRESAVRPRPSLWIPSSRWPLPDMRRFGTRTERGFWAKIVHRTDLRRPGENFWRSYCSLAPRQGQGWPPPKKRPWHSTTCERATSGKRRTGRRRLPSGFCLCMNCGHSPCTTYSGGVSRSIPSGWSPSRSSR